ncbi:MAG: type transporter [Actinomycetia bacterium]|nr:type transporter [Actinomycetes bacterium]
MSHPEQPSGGGSVDTIAEPPMTNSSSNLSEFAAQHGLTKSAARPALGKYFREVWQRRNFIWAFASAKNISMYTESRLGQVWQLLTPLLNAGVYYLIFGLLLNASRLGKDVNFLPWLVAGVFLFGFTQRSINAGSRSVGDNLSLIRALHFPRATLPLAYAVVELQQLVLSLGVLFLIVLSFGETPDAHWLLLLPVVVMQLMFNVGISLVMARIGAFNRDFTQLLPFLLRTWFYFSGVIYSVVSLKNSSGIRANPWIGQLLEANPGYVYVELARRSLLPDYRKYVHAPQHLVHGKNVGGLAEGSGMHLWFYALGWALALLIGGFMWFHRAEERYGRG